MTIEELLEENDRKKAIKHFEAAMNFQSLAEQHEENNNYFLASVFRKNAIHHALKFRELDESYNWGKIKYPDWIGEIGNAKKGIRNPLEAGQFGKKAKVRASIFLGQKIKDEQAKGLRDEYGNRITPAKPRGRPRKS